MDSWLGVEVRHLAALAAVHEARSFRGAADQLGYVQSAVSQRIAQLERVVGARLVDRTRGHTHVELTEAGHALLHHAQRILSQLSAAQVDLRALGDTERRSSVHVGVYQSLATRLLPRALAMLAERAPDIHVTTREALADRDLFAAVEAGELDAAFAELPLEPGPFESRRLLVDPLVLLVPAGSPLAAPGPPPELADIAEHPFVVDPTWRMFGLIESHFEAAGYPLATGFRASTNTAVQALVGAGLGVAVLPRLAADLDDPTTVAIDLSSMLPSRTLVCYWHRDRRHGPALEAFVATMRTVCADVSEANGRSVRVHLVA